MIPYSKTESALEGSDKSQIGTIDLIFKLAKYAICGVILLGALIFSLFAIGNLAWYFIILLDVGAIGLVMLLYFLIGKIFTPDFVQNVNTASKTIHSGTLINKRREDVWERMNGKLCYFTKYYVTLSNTELYMGNDQLAHTISLYDSLHIGKNYTLSHVSGNPEMVLGIRELNN